MICPECGSERVVIHNDQETFIEYLCKYCGMIFEEDYI